jgi:cellulose synthase/poly-beta-1,6-N-acetylglucosamine synthase-like glycosyltransferase
MTPFGSQEKIEVPAFEPEAREEGARTLRWCDYPLYVVLITIRTVVLLYVCWRFGSVLHGAIAAPLAILCSLLLAPACFDQIVWLLLFLYRSPNRRPARQGLRVAAVTTYVGHSESLELLEGTLRRMVLMRYPHDTWLLDEDDDPRVRELCAALGVKHFSRKGIDRFQTASGRFQRATKYGNYNSWLHEFGFERYDVVSSFDCDHAPEGCFLDAVLGFFEDPGVGYVQAAQCYSNQSASFVARGAAEESYCYYSIVQTAAARFGYPVITGCHNTHRVPALREVGGFAAHDADDLLITMKYKAAGWRGVYVPKILARGLAPVSWRAYLEQQRRWARSLFDLKLRAHDAGRSIGPVPRAISILQGIRYVMDGCFILSVFCVTALLLMGVSPALTLLGTSTLLYGAIIVTNLYLQRFYLDPTTESGIPWRAFILRFAKWPYTFMALADVLQRRNYGYTVTPKTTLTGTSKVLMLPQFALAVCMGLAWGIGYYSGHIANPALHLLGASSVAIPILVGVSGRMRFPPEYNKLVSPLNKRPQLTGIELLAASALAVLSFFWSLRGLQGTAVWNDSARHLMNGVFFYDSVRTGNLFLLRPFGKWYFAHFPALSMPYHPPLMPVFEALTFAIFGVSFLSARLLISASVGLCCYLLYRLVLMSSRSTLVALSACAVFLFTPLFQDLQQDIMLEFPALVWVLLAVIYLAKTGPILSVRQGLIYGLLAAAGILTKQTVFLIAVPFVYAISGRKRRAYLQPGLWISAAVGTAAGVLLVLMARSVGWSGVPHHWAPMSGVQALQHNLVYYLQALSPATMVIILSLLIAAVLSWRGIRRNALIENAALYGAWGLSALGVVLFAPAYDWRYLFFLLPAVSAVGCELVYKLLVRFVHFRAAGLLLVVGTMIFCLVNSRQAPLWLTGPELAAGRIASEGMKNVLYFGSANGAFIFSSRLHDPNLQTVIFRGDKIFSDAISSGLLEQFTYEYGVDAIILECPVAAKRECTRFVRDRSGFSPMFEQLLRCSRAYCEGTLVVYRVNNRSPHPKNTFQERISTFGTVQTFHF